MRDVLHLLLLLYSLAPDTAAYGCAAGPLFSPPEEEALRGALLAALSATVSASGSPHKHPHLDLASELGLDLQQEQVPVWDGGAFILAAVLYVLFSSPPFSCPLLIKPSFGWQAAALGHPAASAPADGVERPAALHHLLSERVSRLFHALQYVATCRERLVDLRRLTSTDLFAGER